MIKRLTTEEIEAIRKRAEAATEGPWSSYGFDGESTVISITEYGNVASDILDHDAEFIAEARSDIPKLLAEVERLHAYYEEKLGVTDAEVIANEHVIDAQRKEIEELTSMARWSARRLRPFHRDFILNDLFTLTGVRYDEEESNGYSPTVSELQTEIERLTTRLNAVNA